MAASTLGTAPDSSMKPIGRLLFAFELVGGFMVDEIAFDS